MTKVEDITSVGGGLAQKVVQSEGERGMLWTMEPFQNLGAAIGQLIGVYPTVGRVGRILSGGSFQVGATTYTQVTGIMDAANDAVNPDSEVLKKAA